MCTGNAPDLLGHNQSSIRAYTVSCFQLLDSNSFLSSLVLGLISPYSHTHGHFSSVYVGEYLNKTISLLLPKYSVLIPFLVFLHIDTLTLFSLFYHLPLWECQEAFNSPLLFKCLDSGIWNPYGQFQSSFHNVLPKFYEDVMSLADIIKYTSSLSSSCFHGFSIEWMVGLFLCLKDCWLDRIW